MDINLDSVKNVMLWNVIVAFKVNAESREITEVECRKWAITTSNWACSIEVELVRRPWILLCKCCKEHFWIRILYCYYWNAAWSEFRKWNSNYTVVYHWVSLECRSPLTAEAEEYWQHLKSRGTSCATELWGKHMLTISYNNNDNNKNNYYYYTNL